MTNPRLPFLSLPLGAVPFVVILWLLLPPAADAAGTNAGSTLLVFRHARVFDGQTVLPQANVIVRDGRIAEVGPDVAVSPAAQVVEAAGKTLIPGLIDSHTHVFGAHVLRDALAFGVTTELDMFMALETLKSIRQEFAAGGDTDRADLRSAGTLVTAPGGHGTEYGLPIPTLSSPDGAQAFVDARLAEGSDYIKLVYDDGRTFGISFPTLSQETLRAAINAAHARKKLAVVHIGSLQGARDVINAGADGLAHLFCDRTPDPDFGKFVAEHHAFVVPTLTVLESVCGSHAGAALAADPALAPFLSPSGRAELTAAFPVRPGAATNYAAAEVAVRLLKAARVPLLAGTDAPNPGTTHGASLHRELELLVQAGLTPPEALAAATSVPAERFGLSDRGRIVPGRRADLVLVDGDPTREITATRRIAGVWKLGVALDRQARRDELAKTRAAARPAAAASSEPGGGLISDFEDAQPSAKFGSGWQVSTDSLRGGKSTASFRIVPSGARQSQGALLIEGNVDAGLPYAWAGAIFFPGPTPMAPADLSSKKTLTLWAKGEGRTYSVMLFAPSRNFMPLAQTFAPGPDWKQFRFAIADFDNFDGHDLAGLFIGASLPAGKFSFQIDDVRLE